MSTSITFFPVGNGDMTLISLGDTPGTNILIDCNIRAAADDPDDSTRDVAADLRCRLKTDKQGRPYVDVFLSSHPDEDHTHGLKKHFHLAPLSDYPDGEKPTNEKRIVIREIWSSPIVFRRACKSHPLCEDAKALILGEDEDGKTDDLGSILVKIDEVFNKVNGAANSVFKARLLGPLPAADDDEAEALTKNLSSVILNMELADDASRKTVKNYLSPGDAEVLIWEKLWDKHKKNAAVLAYDILLAPHHCSWHSLSYDSRSEKGDDAKVCEAAKSALSQIRSGGRIIASSNPIKDDDCDPPSHAAKKEYQGIVKKQEGEFVCVGEQPTEKSPAPLEFVFADGKLSESVRKAMLPTSDIRSAGILTGIRADAVRSEAVQKGGNARYA
jgi:hypothetical protein